jgi:hypothetical protein
MQLLRIGQNTPVFLLLQDNVQLGSFLITQFAVDFSRYEFPNFIFVFFLHFF